MTEKIPEMMRAIIQEGPGAPLKLIKIPVPSPSYGEVLIKMAAAPINPSDLSMLNGTYASIPTYPVVPGIEGSGLVVSSGGGFFAGLRKGKRVACSSTPGRDGTWSEYLVTSALKTIPLGNSCDYNQGSMLIVNPLTAMAFLNIARAGKHRAVVNNAAASALGKMLIKLFRSNGIPLINIVRNNKQEALLKDIGATHIINSSEPEYTETLRKTIFELGADLIFDAVGGPETAILIDAAPGNSRIVLYANLSENDIPLNPRKIIQKNRRIEGFFLGSWNNDRRLISKLNDIRKVKKLIASDFHTSISKTFPLDQIEKARSYYKENMTSGKVIIIPNK